MELTPADLARSIDDAKSELADNLNQRSKLKQDTQDIENRIGTLKNNLTLLPVQNQSAEEKAGKLAGILSVDERYDNSELHAPLRAWAAENGVNWRGWSVRNHLEFPGFGIVIPKNVTDEFIQNLFLTVRAISGAAVKSGLPPYVSITLEGDESDCGYMYLIFEDGSDPSTAKYMSGFTYSDSRVKDEPLASLVRRISERIK